MEHLQAKEERTQGGAGSALDPEDLATQVCSASLGTASESEAESLLGTSMACRESKLCTRGFPQEAKMGPVDGY